MKPMYRKASLLATFALALIAAGCGMQKEPATKAVEAAEATLATVKEEAAKYVPDQLATVESTVSGLKDSLAKGDYKAVLAGAPAATSALTALQEAVTAKKAEALAALEKAKTEWATMSADLPKMVEAIGSRLAILAKSKSLPKGIDKAALESAKSGFETMKASWTEATAAFTAGNVADAVAKAQAVKDKGVEVMKSLNMGG